MEHKTEKNMLMLKGEASPCLQPRHSGYGLCDVVTRSLSREFPWLVRLLTTFASAIYNYAYSRVFQHPLERALRRRARNAQATVAHGSRNEPCGMNCSLSCRTRCGTSFPRPRHADGNRHQLFMSEKKALRLSLLRTLTWPRPSASNVRSTTHLLPP